MPSPSPATPPQSLSAKRLDFVAICGSERPLGALPIALSAQHEASPPPSADLNLGLNLDPRPRSGELRCGLKPPQHLAGGAKSGQPTQQLLRCPRIRHQRIEEDVVLPRAAMHRP